MAVSSFRNVIKNTIFRLSFEAVLLAPVGAQPAGGPSAMRSQGLCPDKLMQYGLQSQQVPKDTAQVKYTNALHECLTAAQQIIYNEMFVTTQNKPD